MSMTCLVTALAAGALAQPGGWKPASGPLTTRWAAGVSPESVLPEYPRPQMVRDRWMNLNGLWQVRIGEPGENPPFGADLPERILVPFPVESALSGVMREADWLWYRRTFEVPAEWKGGRVLLHFGGVDWETTAYINGKPVGTHRGGFDAFAFDITDALTPAGAQELVVAVFDPTDDGTQPRGKQVNRPQGIFYTSTTGIWQTVWLEPVPATRIEALTIVPDAAGRRLRVSARVAGEPEGCELAVGAYDGDTPLGEARVGAAEVAVLTLPGARLWTPDDPALYDLRVSLRRGGREADAVRSYFGLRDVRVAPGPDGKTRILLNGEPLFQVGTLDQGFWPDGLYTAPSDEALRSDIEITKRLGFNMIRKHVKVEPARWYFWCDRLGVLVWQDMPSGDRSIGPGDPDITRSPASARQFEQELRAMVSGLSNHPSIILWVVFNEGWGQYDTARIVSETRALDPTRLVSNASGWADRGVGDILDIHVYPGPGGVAPEPARAAVLGEFGGLGLPVRGHTWTTEAWGYQGMADADALTARFENLFRRVWQLKDDPGLSAVVYTQTTDVETECNGLLTYDRAVLKMDEERTRRAVTGRFPPLRTIVPTSEHVGQAWRYITERPADGWEQPGFDDSAWRSGEGGLGTPGTPGAVVRTTWDTGDVWARRVVEVPPGSVHRAMLLIHHDEDAEVYVNGVPAAKLAGYTTAYELVPMPREAAAALKPGRNVIAVHCRQTRGGQYIDVGIVDEHEPTR